MRIGIFGGVFNPIHMGHLLVAEEARKLMELERVLFVPSGHPPHKDEKAIAPSRHRLEMTRLAVRDYPHFQIVDSEVTRLGKSYSVETVRELRQDMKGSHEFFFIVGLDAFKEFPTWRDVPGLLSLCHLSVVSRPGELFSSQASVLDSVLSHSPSGHNIDQGFLAMLDGRPGAPETLMKYVVRLQSGFSLIFLRVAPWKVSSSEIRSRLVRGESVKNLLPDSVESYILKNGLYREEKNQ